MSRRRGKLAESLSSGQDSDLKRKLRSLSLAALKQSADSDSADQDCNLTTKHHLFEDEITQSQPQDLDTLARIRSRLPLVDTDRVQYKPSSSNNHYYNNNNQSDHQQTIPSTSAANNQLASTTTTFGALKYRSRSVPEQQFNRLSLVDDESFINQDNNDFITNNHHSSRDDEQPYFLASQYNLQYENPQQQPANHLSNDNFLHNYTQNNKNNLEYLNEATGSLPKRRKRIYEKPVESYNNSGNNNNKPMSYSTHDNNQHLTTGGANYNDESSLYDAMSTIDLGEPPALGGALSQGARSRRSATSFAREQQLRATIAASMDDNLDGLWAPPQSISGAAAVEDCGLEMMVPGGGVDRINLAQHNITTATTTNSKLATAGCRPQYLSSNMQQQQPSLNEMDEYNDDDLTPHKSIAHESRTGFELAWLKLRYSVKPNMLENPRWGKINAIFHKHPRTILKGISGGLRSGQFVALMGPSGAGKTCLLECIAGIRRTGQEGRICLRGRKKAQLVIVPQYDNFLPEFTVEEIIAYGSRMKNPIKANHAEIVDKVIAQLGLKGCRRNKIKKCSGGQQKRVAIAQELVSKPNILILDEPSSGLDSSICYQTMKVLRQVLELSLQSDQPMAIVTTIHQPSAKVFRMFDLVYVLGKTGHFAYSGPPERVVETIRQATGLECPKYSNPADYIIELISYDYGQEPVEHLIELELEKARQFELDFKARSKGQTKPSSGSLWKASSLMSLARKSITSRRSRTGASPSKQADKNGPGQDDTTQENDNCDAQSTGAISLGMRSVMSESQLAPPGAKAAKLVSILKSNNNNSSSNLTIDRLVEQNPKHLHQHPHESVFMSTRSRNASQTNLSVTSELCDALTIPQRPYVTYTQNSVNDLSKVTSNKGAKHPFFWHLYWHSHRSIKQSMRDPILNKMRFVFHIGFAVLIVILFGQDSGGARGCPPVIGLSPEITDPDHENIVDLSDNVGWIFMCMMMITYVSLMTMTLTFPLEIKTVCVEYRNGWYGISSFFLGKTFGDLPFILLYPIVYVLMVYFLTNQATDAYMRPAYFCLLIILNALNSQTLGLMMGAIFVNSITAATFLGPVTTIPWYLVTGFPKRIPHLPAPLRKMSRYMFTRHIFDGLLVTMFGYDRCNCTAWVEKYFKMRDDETLRLGQVVDAESLLALDYYEDLDSMKRLSYQDSTELTDTTTDSNALPVEAWDTWQQPSLFKIMEKNKKTDDLFGFGLDYEPSCPANYSSFVYQEFNLHEDTLQNSIIIAIVTLIILRFLTFAIVNYKIRTRELG